MDLNLSKYFYLFEKTEQNFERKLLEEEKLFVICQQNEFHKSFTCISIRKWYFDLRIERALLNDSQTLKYIFFQVIL
jgi:hypothetical protein